MGKEKLTDLILLRHLYPFPVYHKIITTTDTRETHKLTVLTPTSPFGD